MHVPRTSRFAKRRTNASREFREERRLANDIVSAFRISQSNGSIEFRNQVSKRATSTMAERDSASVAATGLTDNFNRSQFAFNFLVILNTLFDRAVHILNSSNLFHDYAPFAKALR